MATARDAGGSNNLYTITKGRFKAIDTNTFGLFLIFLNNGLKVAENVVIVASHFSSVYESDPKGSWAEIEERILTLKWKGEYAQSVTRDVQTFMEASLKSDRAEELYSLIKQNAVPKIENLVFSLLMKPLGDKNIHIELSWENVTGEEIQLAKDARENRDARESGDTESLQVSLPQQETQEFDVEEGAVVLDVDLILAPVSGIPIYELAPGDKIMIKINPSTNRGRYFIDLLNAMHENEVVPVPGTVNEVKLNKFNEYTILVKIGEGIYGKAIETEQVKLKRFDPVADRKSSTAAAKGLSAAGFGAPSAAAAAEDKGIKNLYWLMYLGGFVVLAAILFIGLSLL